MHSRNIITLFKGSFYKLLLFVLVVAALFRFKKNRISNNERTRIKESLTSHYQSDHMRSHLRFDGVSFQPS